jgi:hypothetical protein
MQQLTNPVTVLTAHIRSLGPDPLVSHALWLIDEYVKGKADLSEVNSTAAKLCTESAFHGSHYASYDLAQAHYNNIEDIADATQSVIELLNSRNNNAEVLDALNEAAWSTHKLRCVVKTTRLRLSKADTAKLIAKSPATTYIRIAGKKYVQQWGPNIHISTLGTIIESHRGKHTIIATRPNHFVICVDKHGRVTRTCRGVHV